MTDVEQINQLFSEWNAAFDDGRFDDVCAMNTQEFNEELVSEFREAVKDTSATCPFALEVMSSGSGPGKQSLRELEVRGDTAKGSVGPNTWKFAQVDGSWKVAYAD